MLASIRTDVTYPGFAGERRYGRELPPCPITATDTDDEVWIPIVAREGWTILTRDQAIQNRTAEKDAVLRHGAKMFAIASPGQLRTWDLLRITRRHREAIEASCEREGPVIYRMTLTQLTEVELELGDLQQPPGRDARAARHAAEVEVTEPLIGSSVLP